MKLIEKSCYVAALVCTAVGLGLRIAKIIADEKRKIEAKRREKFERERACLFRLL